MVRKYRKDFKTCHKTPFNQLILPFERFISLESSSSIILLITVSIAFIWANTSFSNVYFSLISTNFTISLGDFALSKPIFLWINDGLMAIFFLMIGLEIKREVVIGELSELQFAKLPIFAAFGGMIVPILIFIIFNLTEGNRLNGWAIPMATDIAISLGVLSLFGKRVPISLKIFLTSMAIIDDIGAVVIIAIFYTEKIYIDYLFLCFFCIFLLFLLNFLKIRKLLIFIIVGIFLWIFLLKSGLHATLAGIILSFSIPATKKIDLYNFREIATEVVNKLPYDIPTDDPIITPEVYDAAIQSLESSCHDMRTPLSKFEHIINPWVIFIIAPIFAFVNSGTVLPVNITNSIFDPISLGIIFGLVIGKPLGVTLFSWIGVKIGFTSLPDDINWKQIHSASWLTGIGFTMSYFIASLAFLNEEYITIAKVGILLASLLASIIGYILLYFSIPDKQESGNCAD